MTDGPRARGSFLIYAAAFGLMVLAGIGVAIAAWSFLESFTMLWVSIVASALAIVAAAVATLAPRRR